MEAGLDLSQEMRSWVSPSLIEANYILSLSRQELQHAVQAEIEANPALDVEDFATCPVCDNVLEGSFCPICLTSQKDRSEPERYEDMPELLINLSQTREDNDDFDPLALVAQGDDIRDQILRDARTLLPAAEFPIAEFLVDAIDERGIITCDLEELAALVNRPLAEIEAIVEVIQDVAPVGVGARSLEESLLLQIAYLRRAGVEVPPQVEPIVARHLTELGAHRFGQIAKELGYSAEEVEAARDFIRSYLNPFPLQTQQARSWRTPTGAQYVAPDVVIVLMNDDLHVEVVDTPHFHLRLNPIYDKLSVELTRRRPAAADGSNGNGHAPRVAADPAVSSEDRDHIRNYSSRAKLFIANIHQRRETLLKISRCICELQEPFLRGGVRELKPLTRAIVAQQVGVHESTVSRATANKYVMLPSRKVIPFSDFFTPSLSVKDVIKELVEQEANKGEHLTDRRICDLLMDRGIRIARRTVAKYRAELGILPSTMR